MATMSRRLMQRLALMGLLLPAAGIAGTPAGGAGIPAGGAGIPEAAPQRRPYNDAHLCAQGSHFFVENHSDQPVLQVYVRITGAPEWGADLLGERVLAKGETVRLDIGPQMVDVLALRADGRAFLSVAQHSCWLVRVRVEADRAVSIP